MTPDLIRRYVLPAAYALLPAAMASEAATATLVAIGWQESQFQHRKQIADYQDGRPIYGPAQGFWQFEQGGAVRGVLRHHATAALARSVWADLRYPGEPTAWAVYDAIRHNDVLAAAFARLLLWTVPDPLPAVDRPQDGWEQYLQSWNPGKPKPGTWPASWRVGWTT